MITPIKYGIISEAQPFIKWAGGKRGILPQILPLIPKNFNNYFEPFVGGGALFFKLYSLGHLKDKRTYIFDINSELINAYSMVKNNPHLLIKELKDFKKKHSNFFYYEIRGWDRKDSFFEIGELTRAARFIYLNKTCFNGLYRVNKKNQNNVPIGNYKDPNICDSKAIYNASEALRNTTIMNISYKEVLKYASKDDFVFFDPPYYPLSETSSFTSYNEFNFLGEEQKELFEVFKKLDNIGSYVCHSNSDTKFIEDLYKNFNIQKIQANRFINSKSNNRGKINELIIRNIYECRS